LIELIHTVAGFASLITGVIVLTQRKGTNLHRLIGRMYFAAMISLNITAFGIYELFGGFGIFHWAALVSLATLFCGYITVTFRHKIKNWLSIHYEFMAWSYLGLLGATSNEAFVHIDLLTDMAKTYSWLPLVSMISIFIIGGIVIQNRKADTIGKVNQHMYRR